MTKKFFEDLKFLNIEDNGITSEEAGKWFEHINYRKLVIRSKSRKTQDNVE